MRPTKDPNQFRMTDGEREASAKVRAVVGEKAIVSLCLPHYPPGKVFTITGNRTVSVDKSAIVQFPHGYIVKIRAEDVTPLPACFVEQAS